MRKTIAFGLMLIGLLVLVGSAGSVDVGRYTFTEILPTGVIGLCLTAFGSLWVNGLERREK